jgi:hypothetical protein
MERSRPVRNDPMSSTHLTDPYRDGQWDTLVYCARLLHKLAESDQDITSEKVQHLVRAIQVKARLVAANNKPLGDNDGQHEEISLPK